MNSDEPQNNSVTDEVNIPEFHRVLVVDDEPAICFAYRRLLECERFKYDICETVESAIELLSRYEYFAVISDVRFAGSDNEAGVYFLSVVKEVQPLANLILVTGYGNDELEKTARSLGVSHYFEKPVKPSMILNILRALHLVVEEIEKISSSEIKQYAEEF